MRTPVLVKAGEAPLDINHSFLDPVTAPFIDPPPFTVGEYSGIAVDPVDGSFWATTEYATLPRPATPTAVFLDINWGTWVANFFISEGCMQRIGGNADIVAAMDDEREN